MGRARLPRGGEHGNPLAREAPSLDSPAVAVGRSLLLSTRARRAIALATKQSAGRRQAGYGYATHAIAMWVTGGRLRSDRGRDRSTPAPKSLAGAGASEFSDAN
jgi:hypothetical protein